MHILTWIIIFGVLMSAIALVGALTLVLPEALFREIILPLVGLAAGTLIGGALFHLLPSAVAETNNANAVYLSLVIGFIAFFILEQFLHWHHCHRSPMKHKPVSYLILSADALHNFIGGFAVGAAFVVDIRLGIVTWLVAAAHEVPQELGDFGILIHSGWKRKTALIFNFLSGLTFPIGAILSYVLSKDFNAALILAFAAGNFLYIGATDLIPQLQTEKTRSQLIQFSAFILGLVIMYSIKIL